MLQNLFSNLKSLTIKLFLGLIALSFAVWGVGDIFQGGSDPTVATIGKTDIKASQVAQTYNRELEQLRRLTNGQIDAEQARALGIVENTLQQLISKGAIDQQTKEFGMAASDKIVAKEIKKSPNFHNELGQFDKAIFQYSVGQSGMTEDSFIETVRNDIVRNQLVGALLSGSHAPTSLSQILYKHATEKRSVAFVIIGQEQVGKAPHPSASEIYDFYKENPQEFTSEPYRSASYVELRPFDFTEEIQISEETLLSEYEYQIDRFTTEPKVDINLIVFPDRDTALSAVDMINAGQDFISIGTSMTDLSEDDLDLGLVGRSALLPELADVAFNTIPGNITAPIKTDFGWNILKVNAIQNGGVEGFSEAKSIIREELATEEAIELVYELSNRLEDHLAAGRTLEEAARLLGLNVKLIPPITISGFGQNGDMVENLPPSRELLPTVFASQMGEDIPILEAEANSIYKIRVNEIFPRALLPLESVEDLVVTSWQSAWRDKKALELASQFINTATELGFNDAILQMGIDPLLVTELTRDGEGLKLNLEQQSLRFLFELPLDGISGTLRLGPEKYAVASVTQIIQNEVIDEDELEITARELNASLQTDLLTGLQTALREKYKLTVDEKVLSNLF
tara:strand:- start:716 stop:2596 length:1881 start_codon:yes stop_codon:yes gene_type:complete